MEAFILEHIIDKQVSVNCGQGDVFFGVAEGCSNGVLRLRQQEGIIYINIEKIVTLKIKT